MVIKLNPWRVSLLRQRYIKTTNDYTLHYKFYTIVRIEIQKLNYRDIDSFIELIDLFEEVFEMKHAEQASKYYLEELLSKDEFYAFVAVSEGTIVGGLTAYSLMQYFSEAPLLYVYDVAVMKRYQRKGIGKKLMLGIRDYCSEIGIQEIIVQADEADEHAIEFYHSTGAKAAKVVQFYYGLNG